MYVREHGQRQSGESPMRVWLRWCIRAIIGSHQCGWRGKEFATHTCYTYYTHIQTVCSWPCVSCYCIYIYLYITDTFWDCGGYQFGPLYNFDGRVLRLDKLLNIFVMIMGCNCSVGNCNCHFLFEYLFIYSIFLGMTFILNFWFFVRSIMPPSWDKF